LIIAAFSSFVNSSPREPTIERDDNKHDDDDDADDDEEIDQSWRTHHVEETIYAMMLIA
jgi:hypothetical protein